MLRDYIMKHTLELFNVFRDMTARERAETYFDVLKHLGHNIKQVHSDLYFCRGHTYTSEQLLEEIKETSSSLSNPAKSNSVPTVSVNIKELALNALNVVLPSPGSP